MLNLLRNGKLLCAFLCRLCGVYMSKSCFHKYFSVSLPKIHIFAFPPPLQKRLAVIFCSSICTKISLDFLHVYKITKFTFWLKNGSFYAVLRLFARSFVRRVLPRSDFLLPLLFVEIPRTCRRPPVKPIPAFAPPHCLAVYISARRHRCKHPQAVVRCTLRDRFDAQPVLTPPQHKSKVKPPGRNAIASTNGDGAQVLSFVKAPSPARLRPVCYFENERAFDLSSSYLFTRFSISCLYGNNMLLYGAQKDGTESLSVPFFLCLFSVCHCTDHPKEREDNQMHHHDRGSRRESVHQ